MVLLITFQQKSKHFEQYFNNQPDENLQASPVNDRRMLNK